MGRWSKNEGRQLYNGNYKDEETAAHASDTLARKLMKDGEQNHKLNFSEVFSKHMEDFTKPYKKTSKYFGVSYCKSKERWIVQRWSKSENKNSPNGAYKDEETAAHASDAL